MKHHSYLAVTVPGLKTNLKNDKQIQWLIGVLRKNKKGKINYTIRPHIDGWWDLEQDWLRFYCKVDCNCLNEPRPCFMADEDWTQLKSFLNEGKLIMLVFHMMGENRGYKHHCRSMAPINWADPEKIGLI